MDFASESALCQSLRFSTGSPSGSARSSDPPTQRETSFSDIHIFNCLMVTFLMFFPILHRVTFLCFKIYYVQQTLKPHLACRGSQNDLSINLCFSTDSKSARRLDPVDERLAPDDFQLFLALNNP